VTWRERPICLDCQRTIHGPGTGPVGPTVAVTLASGEWWRERGGPDTPRCVLCHALASPAATMRLWQDEPLSFPEPPEAA